MNDAHGMHPEAGVHAHKLTFRVYGARIGVRTNEGALLDEITPILPPHRQNAALARVDWLYSIWRGKGARPNYTLTVNGQEQLHTRQLARALDWLGHDVQLAVAQAARGRVFVHAGVVGWRGRALLLPGKSFAGKSTLVRALVRAGALYYSDEYAVLDARGRVHPFARPLALRDAKKTNRQLSFAQLGGEIGTKPLPVALVVAAEYREGARWRPKPLSPGQGALELLAHTVTARTKQREALQVLARVATQAQLFQGTRGEAAEVVRWLLERFES